MAEKLLLASRRSGPLPIQMNKLALNPMELLPADGRSSADPSGSVNLPSMRPEDLTSLNMPYRCANPACATEEGKSELWTRQCGMCGMTFCYACTADVRKLSATGQPDPMGKEKRVCASCTNKSWEDGNVYDHKQSFVKYRTQRAPKAVSEPILPQPEKPVVEEKQKSSAVMAAERLVKGYLAHSGVVSGLMADFKVPAWQKPEGWQSTRDAKACEACKAPLRSKRLGQKSMVHCRLCGKIFCVDCTVNEMLLYITEEGMAKWAINGREGGPTSKPRRYELLKMCDLCCQELESAILSEIIKEIEESATVKEVDFGDSLRSLQQHLMSLQHRVEQLLGEYRRFADSFWMAGNTVKENPFHQLAKTQCHLSGSLTQLSIETKKLQSLKPLTKLQERLLRSVSSSFSFFYQESLCLYRQHQANLSEVISVEALQDIQRFVSMVSMGDVLEDLNVLMFNGLDLQKRYHFSDSILLPAVTVQLACEQELKAMDHAFFTKHVQAMRERLKKEASAHPMFSIFARKKAKNHVMASAMFCSIAAAKLQDVLRTLMEKTVEGECTRTKAALKEAVVEIESAENMQRQILTSMTKVTKVTTTYDNKPEHPKPEDQEVQQITESTVSKATSKSTTKTERSSSMSEGKVTTKPSNNHLRATVVLGT